MINKKIKKSYSFFSWGREREYIVDNAWGTGAPWYVEGRDKLKGYFWESNDPESGGGNH